MLPKKNLLNLTHSFQKLRTQGKRTKLGPLTIFSLSDRNQTEFRAAVIVPATTTKLKPTRNRIRRLIFKNLRKNTARFPHHLQFVIMVYEDLTQWDKSHLEKLFDHLNNKIDFKY